MLEQLDRSFHQLRQRGIYWLCSVAGGLAASPKVQVIRDPAGKLCTGEWSA
jgi:hypothetical protein